MAEITHQDLQIILQAAMEVAAADEAFLDAERGLINALIEKAGLSYEEARMVRGSIDRGDVAPVQNLSSHAAKRLCQLVIASTAVIDRELTEEEQATADEISFRLGLDPIAIDPAKVAEYTEEAYRLFFAQDT